MSEVEIMLMAFLRQRRRAHIDEIIAHMSKFLTDRTFSRSGIRNIIMRINAKLPDNSRIRMVEGGRGKGKAVYELIQLQAKGK